MKEKQLKLELLFYKEAFTDNIGRRKKGFGWRHSSSKSVMQIVKENNLDKNAQDKRVLDLGCGDGRHTYFFRKKGFEVVGVDFCKEAIGLCKKRFKKDDKIILEKVDLSVSNSIEKFRKFDIILDWSVLDHIRREYISIYKKNITNAVKKNGFLILVEFDISISGLFKNRDYKVKNGHYSRGYKIFTLVNMFSDRKSVV